MTGRKAFWLVRVRACTRGMKEHDIEAVAQRLHDADLREEPSCVWHETWAYVRETYPWPLCDICDGPVDPRAKRHELCRLRKLKGLPTPLMDQRPACGCAKCRS